MILFVEYQVIREGIDYHFIPMIAEEEIGE